MAGGRLIFPRLVDIALLDTSATNYDPALREPALERRDPSDRIGRKARRERVVRAAAQVSPKLLESLRAGLTGPTMQSDVALVFHYEDLDERGLIGPDGDPAIKVGGRLVRILTMESERVIVEVEEPGLYIIEAARAGYGFGEDAEWNLLKVRLQDREKSSDR